MKLLVVIFSLLLIVGCASSTHKEERIETPETIYLAEDIDESEQSKLTEMEKTRSGPVKESEYIFDIYSDEKISVYKFDEYNQPKIPGVPIEKEYKTDKRLWEKPERFKP